MGDEDRTNKENNKRQELMKGGAHILFSSSLFLLSFKKKVRENKEGQREKNKEKKDIKKK